MCELLQTGLKNYADLALNLKSIYLRVAHKYEMTRVAIERNLHTLVEKWEMMAKEKFDEVFDKEPTNAE